MKNDEAIIILAGLYKFEFNTEIYQLANSLNGRGASSFKYTDEAGNNKHLFVKFLIAPRTELELYRFRQEIKFLELLNQYNRLVKTTPNLCFTNQHETLPIYYYVTEWIDGESLEKKLSELEDPGLSTIVEIIHRCCSSAAYISGKVSHRDFHPGNVFLLDDEPNWALGKRTRDLVDAKVIITDFGNAIMPLAFSYEDEGFGNIELLQHVNRRIEGSFRSLPPETFDNPIDAILHNPGCAEAWSLGILFYKLLANEDILNIESITEYSKVVYSENLPRIISDKIDSLAAKLENNYVLISILRGLLTVDGKKRMSIGLAAGLFWDYRFGNLNEQSQEFQELYIRHQRNYPPRRPDEEDFY